MLDEILNQKIEEFDFDGMIREIAKEKVYRMIEEKTDSFIKEKLEAFVGGKIASEFEKRMNEPVEIKDAWGHYEKFNNFEELFRSTFKKQLLNDWNMKEKLSKIVNERINKIINEDGISSHSKRRR